MHLFLYLKLSVLYLNFLEVCLQPLFPKGHIESVDNMTLGDRKSVICDAGFKAESLNTTCSHSGFWDPQPVCNIVMCLVPVIDNGSFKTSSAIMSHDGPVTPDIEFNTRPDNPDDSNATPDYTYNTTVFLECNHGYKANGPTSFTCLSDRSWSHRTSPCVKLFCNDTDEVNHEAVIRIPDLGINETGNALYNTDHFFLSDRGIELERQVNRKLK